MFLANSRYARTPVVTARGPGGRDLSAVMLRRLPETAGTGTVVNSGDKLDVMSLNRYRDGNRYWFIADANTELEANALVRPDGRVIRVPER